MNPEIEKMAADELLREEEAEEARREKDVQDEEMAEYYSSVNKTVARKFATKRGHEGQKLTPPAASGSAPATSSNVSDDILEKTSNFLQSMRNKSDLSKDQNTKKRKFMKPAEDQEDS